MTDSTLSQAASTVLAAELSALQTLNTLIASTSSAIDTLVAGLAYPANFPSDAVSVASNLKASLMYPGQQVQQKLLALDPPAQPAPATMPTPTPTS